ncbi:efflux RND transporter permease subunit [Candidatus Avelusimicrobium fimicolum]|jgi:HAE1 family hydrophobic/amphiphilic exporter-1|uniref:efflux RND transporter permease subunit n=1 Tax=Candidatus Avelusimicrobium fimicolum TaxID=3416216 RepID=UPI0015A777AA|nr:efflux RND transporter permease subunit [Spirochaetia bacterium]
MAENNNNLQASNALEKEKMKKGGFTAVFIRRPVATIMMCLAIVVIGLMSYSSMGVGMFPNVDVPYVLVQTTLAGASPEEIETSVTKIIEESVNQVEGIDEIKSQSMEGASLVSIKFLMDKDGDVAAQEVRDKVELIKNELPDGTEAPVVQKLDMDSIAVLNVVVSGDRDIVELTEIAKKKVKENIENIRGVGAVNIVGGREREIHITVNPLKLFSLNLPISDVAAALADQNVEIPGGRVEQQHQEYTLRILGRIPDVPSFNDIFIANRNGASIKIADIGYAEDSGEYERESTFLNKRRAVTLEITKQSGTNTLAVVQGVKDKLEKIKPTLPADISLSLMMDQSGNIKASVHSVLEHLVLGGILAGIMVFFFMGSLRSTFISFLAMPISIIGSFIFMNMAGFTIDTMTLLGLLVAVGIVIDDAIVMLENIFRHMEKYGKSPKVAAIDGSHEITSTVVATTLSILVIFLPLAYMSGIVGRIVNSYGMTVVFAIALSGVVALTLTPMLCAKMLKQEKKTKLDLFVDGVNKKLVDWYIPLLDWSIHHRKIMVSLACLCLVLLVPMLARVGGEFMPTDDSGKVQVSIEAPVGTSYTDTQDILKQIEKDIRRLPHVKDTLVAAGVSSSSFVSSNPSNKGYVRVEFESRDKRDGVTTKEYLDAIREMMKKYKGLKSNSYVVSETPSSGSYELEFVISGPDINKLSEYSQAMVQQLSKDPRFIDVDTSLDLSKPEYRVVINREKAQNLGVKITSIASALRTMVGGEDDITKYKEGDDLYDVRVRVAEEYRDTKEAISALMVPGKLNGKDTIQRLDSVAYIEEGTGPSQIDRHNRQRQVTVQANLNGIDTRSALAIMNDIFHRLNAGAEYSGGVTGMSEEMTKMFSSFLLAFVLAFFFKYMILAAQFESYTHPVAIIVSLPLTLPFAVLSLFLTGQSLNLYSLLGIFMLIGVVSKNAILQTDYTNQLRARGYGRTDAILQANRVRLRPILMTTLTLIMGVAPMIFSNGEGADQRRSLAIVIVGGQALSLLVTLLMTPVTYILMDELGDWFNYTFKGIPYPEDKSKTEILPEVPEED